MNFGAKLNICSSISPPSQSPRPLCLIAVWTKFDFVLSFQIFLLLNLTILKKWLILGYYFTHSIMNIHVVGILIFLQLVCIKSYCQNISNPTLSIGVGYSYNFVIPQGNSLQNCSNGFNVGFISEKILMKRNPNIQLWLGFVYNYRLITDYENTVFYMPKQMNVNLNTSLKQHFFVSPIVVRYKFKHTRFSIGGGIILSYMFHSEINQTVKNEYNDINVAYVIHDNFELKNYTDLSSISRVNISPLLNISYKLSQTINLEYIFSYDLISNPQMYFKMNSYNVQTNNLLLTFKLKL